MVHIRHQLAVSLLAATAVFSTGALWSAPVQADQHCATVDPATFSGRYHRLAREARAQARTMRNRAQTYRNYDREIGDAADDGDFWSRQVISAEGEARHWEQAANTYEQKAFQMGREHGVAREHINGAADCTHTHRQNATRPEQSLDGVWTMTTGSIRPGLKLKLKTKGNEVIGTVAEIPASLRQAVKMMDGLSVGRVALLGTFSGGKFTGKTRFGITMASAAIRGAAFMPCKRVVEGYEKNHAKWMPLSFQKAGQKYSGQHRMIYFKVTRSGSCTTTVHKNLPPRFRGGKAPFEMVRADEKAGGDQVAAKQSNDEKPEAEPTTRQERNRRLALNVIEQWNRTITRNEDETSEDYTNRLNERLGTSFEQVYSPADARALSRTDLERMAWRYSEFDNYRVETVTYGSGEDAQTIRYYAYQNREMDLDQGVYFMTASRGRYWSQNLTLEVLYIAKYNGDLARDYLRRSLAGRERRQGIDVRLAGQDLTMRQVYALDLDRAETALANINRTLADAETLLRLAEDAGSLEQRQPLSRIIEWLNIRRTQEERHRDHARQMRDRTN